MRVTFGTGPFSIDSDLPNGVTGDISGRIITLIANDEASQGRYMLVIEDEDDLLGIREIRIEL